jgi:Domain of Unknown Function (DUF1080)
MIRIAAGTLVLGVVLCPNIASANEWVKLFDGTSLNGWTQRNGTATYRVDQETIVGTTNEGSPNSFLCTDKEYGDFELEFDVKVDNRLNSGVQIRSKGKAEGGRVYGPQVEIEASGPDGALAGYVYGEATDRGWLTPESRLKRHKHFHDGDWNHYRILAKGPRIQTWINGEMIEDLTDASPRVYRPAGSRDRGRAGALSSRVEEHPRSTAVSERCVRSHDHTDRFTLTDSH